MGFLGTRHYRGKAQYLYFEHGGGELADYSKEELAEQWSVDLVRLCDELENLAVKRQADKRTIAQYVELVWELTKEDSGEG